MNVVKEVAKTRDEALNLVLKKLNANEREVIYDFKEIKGGLFKGTVYECSAFLKIDILDDVQEFLKNILNGMGIEVSFEVSTKDNTTTIKMYSSDNPIIIGRNGQNLEALTMVVRQYVKNITYNGPRIVLDVEDYKEKRIAYLEKLAIRTAKEVRDTKIDVTLDNMNSYERRIIHNKLTDFKGITTTSEGEEPNRHIIIKAEK